MTRHQASYHATLRFARASLACALFAWAAPATAEDFSFDCEGTTITLSCEDGAKTGNCRTSAASDPTWNVTCRGHEKVDGKFQMDCRNATDIGGTATELTFPASHLGEQLTEAVSDNTGTSCTLTP